MVGKADEEQPFLVGVFYIGFNIRIPFCAKGKICMAVKVVKFHNNTSFFVYKAIIDRLCSLFKINLDIFQRRMYNIYNILWVPYFERMVYCGGHA